MGNNMDLKVGDEVYRGFGKYRYVVTKIINRPDADPVVRYMMPDGDWHFCSLEDVKKTGRHFNEIEAVLSMLQEDPE